jgi:hypothetical protein
VDNEEESFPCCDDNGSGRLNVFGKEVDDTACKEEI